MTITSHQKTQYEAELASLDNDFKSNTNSGNILLPKSQLLIKLQRYEEAVITLRQLISVDPTNPQPWLLLSNALKALQRYEEATAAHNRYLKMSPQTPSTPDISGTSGNNGVANLDEQAFLNNYCLALFRVESRNQEVLNAREELKWYENELNEADQLARELDLKNSTSLPAVKLPAFTKVAKERVASAIAKARSEVIKYKNTQNELKETRERLQKQVEDTMSSLKSELESNIYAIRTNLKRTEDEIRIIIKNIEQLKTKRMIEILLIVGAGVATVLIVNNIYAVIIAMLITWWISSNLSL